MHTDSGCVIVKEGTEEDTMADEKNTQPIACPDCKSFILDDGSGQPACEKCYPEFNKQLMSGQTTICPDAERK